MARSERLNHQSGHEQALQISPAALRCLASRLPRAASAAPRCGGVPHTLWSGAFASSDFRVRFIWTIDGRAGAERPAAARTWKRALDCFLRATSVACVAIFKHHLRVAHFGRRFGIQPDRARLRPSLPLPVFVLLPSCFARMIVLLCACYLPCYFHPSAMRAVGCIFANL
jgi:hypothetical protein